MDGLIDLQDKILIGLIKYIFKKRCALGLEKWSI